jgi:hypothetical protein
LGCGKVAQGRHPESPAEKAIKSMSSLRAEVGAKHRPKVKRSKGRNQELDCFVARAPRNDELEG